MKKSNKKIMAVLLACLLWLTCIYTCNAQSKRNICISSHDSAFYQNLQRYINAYDLIDLNSGSNDELFIRFICGDKEGKRAFIELKESSGIWQGRIINVGHDEFYLFSLGFILGRKYHFFHTKNKILARYGYMVKIDPSDLFYRIDFKDSISPKIIEQKIMEIMNGPRQVNLGATKNCFAFEVEISTYSQYNYRYWEIPIDNDLDTAFILVENLHFAVYETITNDFYDNHKILRYQKHRW